MNKQTFLVGAVATVCLLAVCLKRRRQKNRRRMWVNPYLQGRWFGGRFNDFGDLQRSPNTFRENFHMDDESFDRIYRKIEKHLVPRKYSRPDVIPPRAKLAMVLEFFACGSLQRHIASTYRISKQSFGNIIDQVCDAICIEMKDEMPPLSKEQWLDVANGFSVKWNFPNCVGALDGKHIAIKRPPNAGSLFFNYKKFHSIVLMAVAGPDYKLLQVDIGAYGSEGDASVFFNTEFGRSIIDNTIELPEDSQILSKKMPFVFIGDDAFPLTDRIIKPFTPPRNRSLTEEEKILNYRLSRARRCVENAFGVLTTKFICLSRTLFCHPVRAQKIVAACCILHNHFLNNFGQTYCPSGFTDRYDENGHLIEGEWRRIARGNMANLQAPHGRSDIQRRSGSGKEVREVFKEFVNSPQGSVEWQRRAVFLE